MTAMTSIPMSGPFPRSVLEYLKDRRTGIMLCVKPRDGYVGIKRSLPLEATIRLQSHTEERHGKTGEIVIVNACVDKGSGDADLICAVLVSALRCGQEIRNSLSPAVLLRYQHQLFMDQSTPIALTYNSRR